MKESFLILCRCQASSATTCGEKGLSTTLKYPGQGCSPSAFGEGHPHLVRPPIRVNSLCVGLVLDAVEVLVQAIEQEGHELLSIVLGIASELAGLAGHDCLGEHSSQGWQHCLPNAQSLAAPTHTHLALCGSSRAAWCLQQSAGP